ncbi:MAG TPA: ABC transporter permease [Chthoniobacteraceae bacterium]|nr:ABC transporter permease [Chthoniobacteraceae bacterium]
MIAALYRTWLLRAPLPFFGVPLLFFLFAWVPGGDGTLLSEFLLSDGNLRFVAVQSVVVAMAAIGMSAIIASGRIDFSAGAQMVFYATLGAAVAARSPVPAVAGVLVAGAVGGTLNGWLVETLQSRSSVVTLAVGALFLALVELLPPVPIGEFSPWMAVFPTPGWLVVAPGVWLTLGVAALVWLLLQTTVYGRQLLAVGSDETAARLCGVRVRRVRLWTFALAGLLFALAGWLAQAGGSSAERGEAMFWEFDVVAAVLIGGTPLRGGSVSLPGTLAGAFFLSLLRNGVWQAGWPPAVAEVAVGGSILLALAWERFRRAHQHAPAAPAWLEAR